MALSFIYCSLAGCKWWKWLRSWWQAPWWTCGDLEDGEGLGG